MLRRCRGVEAVSRHSVEAQCRGRVEAVCRGRVEAILRYGVVRTVNVHIGLWLHFRAQRVSETPD